MTRFVICHVTVFPDFLVSGISAKLIVPNIYLILKNTHKDCSPPQNFRHYYGIRESSNVSRTTYN